MKADRNDAHDYFERSLSQEIKKWAIPALLGASMCVALLTFFVSMVPEPKVIHSQKPQVTARTYKPSTIQANTPTSQEIADDDRQWAAKEVIEKPQHSYDIQSAPHVEESNVKQTVFNDRNYIPRGAINSVGRLADERQFQERESEGIRVQGIKEKTRLKDAACGSDGSISARNCRQQIGLEYRN